MIDDRLVHLLQINFANIDNKICGGKIDSKIQVCVASVVSGITSYHLRSPFLKINGFKKDPMCIQALFL